MWDLTYKPGWDDYVETLQRFAAKYGIDGFKWDAGDARHAAKTGEPIVRAMEYEFPHCGFDKPMTQFMLGPKWLVAPVLDENDAVTVELPGGGPGRTTGAKFTSARGKSLSNKFRLTDWCVSSACDLCMKVG